VHGGMLRMLPFLTPPPVTECLFALTYATAEAEPGDAAICIADKVAAHVLHGRVDGEHLAWLTFDRAGSATNTFSREALTERHRMPVIFRIRSRYEDLWKEENRLLPVEVTSAVELDDATISGIGEQIGEQAGRKIELSSRVDPDILGGIVLRVGNSILDASIRGRLNQLRKQVARAS